jgi:rhamnose transport system substrate-binding protein
MKGNRSIGVGLSVLLLAATAGSAAIAQSQSPVTATPGQDVKMMLLPKFLGIIPFDQANQGAQEAEAELQNQTPFTFTGPTPDNSVQGQIDTLTTAPTDGFKVVMMSNNAGDTIGATAAAAQEAGTKVVTWDSPIPSGEGETVFVAQVDFNEMGKTMAVMANSIMGPEGGQLAVLSATPEAANQKAWVAAFEEALATDPTYANITNVETVFGNDKSEDSYTAAQALIDKYPNLKVIMAPTSVGIVAASKAVKDNGLCDTVKVSGLGVPFELKDYTLEGCTPEFALWDFVDLGYLTYYVGYLIGTDAINGEVGDTFSLGRPIAVNGQQVFTIEKDPTRPDVDARRVLMGPFTVFNKDNVEAAAG